MYVYRFIWARIYAVYVSLALDTVHIYCEYSNYICDSLCSSVFFFVCVCSRMWSIFHSGLPCHLFWRGSVGCIYLPYYLPGCHRIHFRWRSLLPDLIEEIRHLVWCTQNRLFQPSALRSSMILVDTSYTSLSSCGWSMRQGVLSLPPSIVFILNHMIANC